MAQEINGRKIVRNVSISIFAQIVSLLVAFVLNLIVPKYISEYQYAYWQTYMLYANYTGILHLGLLDGIVLRYSQYEYDELNKPLLRSQFYLLMISNVMFASIIIIGATIWLELDYLRVGIFVAISVVLKNAIQYATYMLQITNRIKEYALTSIIQNVVYAIFVILIILLSRKSFYWICVAEMAGTLIALLWTIKYNKECYIGKMLPIKIAWKELKANVSAGIFLLISNSSAMLLLGITKMIVQWRWDKLVFSKVAFSFNITSLFLTFISAISIVLFPALKRMKEENLPLVYIKIRNVLSPLLVVVLIVYFPGTWLLFKWLPSYSESIVYLGVLLPIIIYRTKVSLLTNNYLKAYRKERVLLAINVVSVLVAITGGILIDYAFHNIDYLLIYTVITMMLMSMYAEHTVSKIIGFRFVKENLVEGIMTVVFIICARCLNVWTGFIIYSLIVFVYLLLNRNTIFKNLFKRV